MLLTNNAITREDWDVNSLVKKPHSLRDKVIELQNKLRERAKYLYNNNKINFSEYMSISNECQRILDFAAKINSMQFNKVLTDMDEPAKKIIEATNTLNKAAAKIQEVQKFIDVLSRLIKLGQVVSNAISGVGIAAISTLVTELKSFGDQLNT